MADTRYLESRNDDLEPTWVKLLDNGDGTYSVATRNPVLEAQNEQIKALLTSIRDDAPGKSDDKAAVVKGVGGIKIGL